MGKLTKFFDKVADALVPKEIAPFLGPADMMFAGPLGMPLALGLGQLGSAKMHSGKLDPYTALGTALSAQGYKARNPKGYGRIGSGLKEGIMSIGDGKGGVTFMDAFKSGYENPNYYQNLYSNNLQGVGGQSPGPGPGGQTTFGATPEPTPGFFETEGTLDKFTQGVGEAVFPGFTDPKTGDFDLIKTLTTIGSTTTLSQVMPLAEELKKQKMKDEEEEGAAWKEWFESYKRSSGRSYGDSAYPDPEITRLWNKYGKPFGLAMGGRVGYNEGGNTGIIAAAPGMPRGMQLDGRDGIFVSQGIEEKADDVPAMLSKNEFVLTADAMKGFDKMTGGTGNPRAAAQKMYQLMDQMEAIA